MTRWNIKKDQEGHANTEHDAQLSGQKKPSLKLVDPDHICRTLIWQLGAFLVTCKPGLYERDATKESISISPVL